MEKNKNITNQQEEDLKNQEEEQNVKAEEATPEEQSHENQETEESEAATETTGAGSASVEELEKEKKELKDKFLRLAAEFENYKRRTLKEKMDMMKSAAQDTLSALLPVLDDFDRAKKNADDENTAETFSVGVDLVYKKLYSVLQNKGLKEMESTGQPFDPEHHEALTEIPAPDENMKGKVVDTIEKGYFLNDKIIRHAKVVVGK